jgi:hypothetical protein
MLELWAAEARDELREKLRASFRWTAAPLHPAIERLFQLARAGELRVPIPPETRQRYGRQRGGNTPPAGETKRGRPVSDAVRAREAEIISRRANRESIRAIATATGLTKKQVEKTLARSGAPVP